MKKRILALLLAAMMISSPVAYADDGGNESTEVSSPAVAVAETVGDTNSSSPAETGTSFDSDAATETDNTEPGETAATDKETSEPETQSAQEIAGTIGNTADTSSYEPTAAGNDGNDSAPETIDGAQITFTEIRDEETEGKEPAAEATTLLTEKETSEDEPKAAPTPKPAPTVATDPNKYVPVIAGPNPDTVITSLTYSDPVVVERGEQSEKAFTITGIEIGSMPNGEHQYLQFTFGNPEEGTSFEGYVAGITVYSVYQEGNTKTEEERVVNLVTSVVDRYYANKNFTLTDHKDAVDEYGLCIQSIDTEKIADKDYTTETGKPDRDTELCWAASASNMLEFTGWNNLVNPSLGLINEDKLFDYFAASFTDNGLEQEYGIKWFMNGVQQEEEQKDGSTVYFNYTKEGDAVRYNCYDFNGNLLYYCTTSALSGDDKNTKTTYYNGSNQVLYYYTTDKDHGLRYYFDADNTRLFSYVTANGNCIDENGKIIEPAPGMAYGIENGFAQEKIQSDSSNKGLADEKNGNLLSDYAEENVTGFTFLSPSLTYDALYEAAMDLKEETATGLAIFFLKEDNSSLGGHAVTLFGYIKDTLQDGWQSLKAMFITDSDSNKNVTTTREGALDMVSMHQLEVGTIGTDTKNFLFLQNYYPAEYNVRVPIFGYSILQPYSTALTKETEGTGNAVSTVDYTVRDMSVLDDYGYATDTVNAGEPIYLYTELINRSYESLNNYSSPYFVLNYTLKKDGGEEITYQHKVPVTGSSTVNAFNKLVTEPAYTLYEPGTYTISASIEGIYYTNAGGQTEKIREAYFTNNQFLRNLVLTVKGGVQPGWNEGTSQGEAIPVISRTINANAGGECSIALPELKGEIASVTLNGETLGAGDYTITYSPDGTATITFREEFLNSLLPGIYSFRLLDDAGKLLTVVEITVR